MRKRERIVLAALIVALIAAGSWGVSRIVKLRPATGEPLPAQAPGEGIGRNPAVVRYLAAPEAEKIRAAYRLDHYTEGEGPAPEWYRPDEEMSAEWVEPNPAGYGSNPAQTAENEPLEPRMTISADHFPDAGNMVDGVPDINVGDIDVLSKPHPPVGVDPGGIDWNLCSEVRGWDGHVMEAWEMDAFARVAYLEFWGTSRECCEAGVDAILQLWDSEYFAPTLYGTLSAEAENGAPVFSTWEAVWSADYDPDGLAEMKQICEERFANGPEYEAEFFRTDYYHPWAVPMYQIDNVYFSTGKGWQ